MLPAVTYDRTTPSGALIAGYLMPLGHNLVPKLVTYRVLIQLVQLINVRKALFCACIKCSEPVARHMFRSKVGWRHER